jgi:hypothetical protein
VTKGQGAATALLAASGWGVAGWLALQPSPTAVLVKPSPLQVTVDVPQMPGKEPAVTYACSNATQKEHAHVVWPHQSVVEAP